MSRALKELPGASKWAFFTNPRRSLGGLTPLEVIGGKQPKCKQGGGSTPLEKVNLSMVLRAAAGYAEE
ncbi:hypothetical protein VSR82_39070 [Burkholderia sp. JPY481]